MKRSKVYLNRDQSRRVDQLAMESGISGITLMENAGKGCVAKLMEYQPESVLICCGPGNNGGDGFVIGRRLAIAGIQTRILICGDENRIAGDAKVNFEIAKSIDLDIKTIGVDDCGLQIDQWTRSQTGGEFDWVCDCLLGTGASGNPRPPISDMIDAINRSRSKVLAVDIPSGLDCDSGQPGRPTVKADLTCTFVAKKTGFRNPAASEFLGTVRVVSIGVPLDILEEVVYEGS